MKRKNLNNAGFTLIELLAVITIMGILMMVAIPSVTRTIENTRRDSFATIAQTYINSVRNSVLGSELNCNTATDSAFGTNVAATPNGNYYIKIATCEKSAASGFCADTNAYIKTQTAALMESGGTSSWGGADVTGYVKWEKTADGDGTKTEYYVKLVDSGKHGLTADTKDQQVKRISVATSGLNEITAGPTTVGASTTAGTYYECKLS